MNVTGDIPVIDGRFYTIEMSNKSAERNGQ
jgi:hypothetical protein